MSKADPYHDHKVYHLARSGWERLALVLQAPPTARPLPGVVDADRGRHLSEVPEGEKRRRFVMACVRLRFADGSTGTATVPDAEGWARIKGKWYRWDEFAWGGPTFYYVPIRDRRWPAEIYVEEPSRRLWKAWRLWKRREHGVKWRRCGVAMKRCRAERYCGPECPPF